MGEEEGDQLKLKWSVSDEEGEGVWREGEWEEWVVVEGEWEEGRRRVWEAREERGVMDGMRPRVVEEGGEVVGVWRGEGEARGECLCVECSVATELDERERRRRWRAGEGLGLGLGDVAPIPYVFGRNRFIIRAL